MPRSCRRATSASSPRRRCTPARLWRRRRTPSRTAPSARCRTGSATRRRSLRSFPRVIRGTTFPAGKVIEPGHVQWDVKGDTTIGPFEPKPATLAECERLADACTRAGMPTKAVPDARGPQWRKVIFNAATNPVGALTGLTHGRVCEDPALRRLVSVLVDEGKAVAAAQGIELDADPEDLIDHAARPDVAYGHKASMLQDVEARRQTEIDYLNGGLVRFGRDLGVATPANEAIWALVKGMERAWTARRMRAGIGIRPLRPSFGGWSRSARRYTPLPGAVVGAGPRPARQGRQFVGAGPRPARPAGKCRGRISSGPRTGGDIGHTAGGDRAALRARARGGGARRARCGDRRGERVHGLRGRRDVPVRVRDRASLRVRAAPARRAAGHRLPERGALRRRARDDVDRGAGVRAPARGVAARPLP